MITNIRIFGKGDDYRTNVVLDGSDNEFQNNVTISVIKDTTDLSKHPIERTNETTSITLSNDLAKNLLLALQKYLF